MTNPVKKSHNLSAVSDLLSEAGESSFGYLALEVWHNLQHQHNWTDLRLHRVRPGQVPQLQHLKDAEALTTLLPQTGSTMLVSGLPPRHSYIHPDLLNHLVKHDLTVESLSVQREWVLPVNIAETSSLQQLFGVFDALPERPVHQTMDGLQHHDSKRVLMAMLAHNGMGGDGTIVYYIMQEGDVKPRQN